MPTTSIRRYFSRRQREILRLLCEGTAPKEIAAELEIALGTLNTHLRSMCRLAGVSGGRQLIVFVWQQPQALQVGGEWHRGLHAAGFVPDCPHCAATLKAA